MNKFWTTEEETTMRTMHNNGISIQEIAKVLGRTYNSVEHKIRNLSISPVGETSIQNETASIKVADYFSMLKNLVVSDYKIKRFPQYNFSTKKKSKEILNLIISDMHIGKINEWYDTENNKKIITYNDTIRKHFQDKYMESIIRLLSLWKYGYFFEQLKILFLGDIIDNDRIFQGQQTLISQPVGLQIWSAVAELADMINILSGYFPMITVTGIVGNHGRSTHNNKEEEPVVNNFEYQLYKILDLMLKENNKVFFDVPESRFYSVNNYGHKIFMSHGDTIRGYTISYAERKAKELLINLPQGYSLYIIGHRHRADRIALSPSAELLVNGCWIPNDDYAFKLYGTSTQPCQWIFGSCKQRVISSLCVPVDFR